MPEVLAVAPHLRGLGVRHGSRSGAGCARGRSVASPREFCWPPPLLVP